MRRTCLIAAAILATIVPPGAEALAEFIPFTRPAEAVDATDANKRAVGYEYGVPANRIVVFPGYAGSARSSICPLDVDRTFARRDVAGLEQWQKLRQEIRRSLIGYFGDMPAMDMPLDEKTEAEQDRGDHVLRIVSIKFSNSQRSRVALLIPKGIPSPAPAIMLQDAWGNGIEKMTTGLYSRTLATHLVRQGIIIVGLGHWYEAFGDSSRLCTMGAAVHNVRRVVSYLQTQADLINPKQVGLLGHIYGAEISFFAGAMEERLAALACSDSWFQPTLPYTADYWSPPFWATGASQGLGSATERAQPEMYCSRRGIPTNPLPFLTQEMMALIAPKPLLLVNHGMGYGAKMANNEGAHCIWPVYELYTKQPPIEMIFHKQQTNTPANVRDHMTDFFLRALADVDPGHAEAETTRRIVAELESGDKDRQLRACRLAAWWRCKPAVPALVKLLGKPPQASATAQATAQAATPWKPQPLAQTQPVSPEAVLRRAAAKALERCAAVSELFRFVHDGDVAVRLAAVEAIYIHGADKPVWRQLEQLKSDRDKWVREAKWQALQLNPYE